MKQYKKHILVCELGGNCSGKGASGMRDRVREILAERGLEGDVKVGKAGCLGGCDFGPNLVIYPDGIWYFGVKHEDLSRIIDETVIGERIIDDMLLHKMGDPSVVEMVKDPVCGMTFRANQAANYVTTLAGRTVYFCSEGCQQTYLADPTVYAKKPQGHGSNTAAGQHHQH